MCRKGLPLTFLLASAAVTCFAQLSVSYEDTGRKSEGPEFVDFVKNTTVPVGRTATLKCTVRNLGSHKIGWLDVDKLAILAIDSRLIAKNRRLFLMRKNDSSSLLIHNVKYGDAGRYACQINTSPMKTEEVFLEVVGPPLIDDTLTSFETTADSGESVALRCVARGTPEPTITWRREDDRDIVTADNIRQKLINGEWLNITRIHHDHAGAYLCTASNGVAPAMSKRILLLVNSLKPTTAAPNKATQLESPEPEFVDPPGNLTVPIGQTASLKCTVRNLGEHRVAWLRSDPQIALTVDSYVITRDPRVLVAHINDSYTLEIMYVQYDDAGLYRCKINMKSLDVFLDVVGPPIFDQTLTSPDFVTADAGKNISLRCVARGTPKPIITWRKEDSREAVSLEGAAQKGVEGEWLNLTALHLDDAGAYVCTASNGASPAPFKRIVLEVNSTSSTFTAANNGRAEKPESYTALPSDNGAGVESEEPEFVATRTNVTVSVGREASMICTVRNLGPYRVAWLNADRHTLLSVDSYVIARDGRISMTKLNDTYTLKINDVQYKDAGHYRCQINTVPIKSNAFFLQVVGPPVFLDELASSSNQTVRDGEVVSLRCVAKGSPQPVIKWHREDGREIRLRNGVLQKHVEGEWLNITGYKDDAGTYVCTASNDMEAAATKRIYLEVNYPPLISSPMKQAEEITEGSRGVKLVCTARGHPAPLVYWVEDDGDVITTSSDDRSVSEVYIKGDEVRTILTFPLIRREHFGKYWCVAKNSRGEHVHIFKIGEFTNNTGTATPTIPPNVDEIVPVNEIHPNGATENITATVGAKVHFKCQLNDLGRYKIAWIRIDQSAVLSLGSSVILNDSRFSVKSDGDGYYALHIKRTGYEDSGLYACQINTNPVKTKYTSLQVTGPTLFDEFLSSPSTVVGYLGEGVSLRCVARSASRQPITWRRELLEADARHIKSSAHLAEGQWLNITTLSRRDAGIYVCTMGNSASAVAYRRISLEIFYPPEIVAINFEGADAGSSDTSTLSCGARAHPAPTVYWTKRGHAGLLKADVSDAEVERHVNDDARRTSFLRRVQHKDIDLYSCVAKNALGETSAELRLTNANKGVGKA